MISFRPWQLLLLASWCSAGILHAQESSSGSTDSAGGASTGSSSFGSSPAAPDTGSSSSFGSPAATPVTPGGTTTGGTSPTEAPSTAPSSLFGGSSGDSGLTAKPLPETPTSFSVTSEYGQAPQIFTSGEGRLARPKFKTTLSTSIGFDDNVFQTPTKSRGIPDQVIRQQITAGTAEQIVLEPIPEPTGPVRIGTPIGPAPTPRPQQFRQVVIPAVEPTFEDIVIPGTPAAKRQPSAVSRNTISFEAQTATRRQLFTFNMSVNSDYYWNRPGKKSEYNGSLSLIYLRRLTPRMQFTGSISANYLSQPDLSIANTPTQQGSGNYLSARTKADLSYRWTRRFSTVASLSYNTLTYEDKLRQGGDYAETVLGVEGRYLWSPRLTAVLEGRFGQIRYENNPTLDSHSLFALVGFDLTLTRRTIATMRLGESIRTFEESGKSASAPYLEAAVNYQLGRTSFLQWNSRFGFEEPPDPNTQVLVLRSGLTVTQYFSPRLRGSLALNVIHRASTNDVSDAETIENTFDSNLFFQYTLDRHWNLTLSYSFTTLLADPDTSNYFRNRVFLGAEYDF